MGPISTRGAINPFAYAILAPALLLSQHLAVVIAFEVAGAKLSHDVGFWLTPLSRMMSLPDLTSLIAALTFGFSLIVAWALATLSFRRASRSGVGYVLAALSVVPVIQIGAVALLVIMPFRFDDPAPAPEAGLNVAHVLQGVIAGIAIIVLAVLISAVTFGAYGWGLFVMTPFLVGVTTAYVANRQAEIPLGQTISLVMAAAALGCLALVSFALEGIVCIILAAPLGALAAAAGGAIGRSVALARQRRDKPLLSVAVLPAVFALEAAIPPSVPITVYQTVDIAAPPSSVWKALTSDEPISAAPGLAGYAGLAYPIRGRIIGGERRGQFSTGTARERITHWAPGKRLTFKVLSQPPAMEEMSPYRRVHAPHVSGYFETAQTTFELRRLSEGGTRLAISATHTLRLDPVLYWEPIARWAIDDNVSRVLQDIRTKAERPAKSIVGYK